jgi:hypothetical protein
MLFFWIIAELSPVSFNVETNPVNINAIPTIPKSSGNKSLASIAVITKLKICIENLEFADQINPLMVLCFKVAIIISQSQKL